jgi:hypothetical protein
MFAIQAGWLGQHNQSVVVPNNPHGSPAVHLLLAVHHIHDDGHKLIQAEAQPSTCPNILSSATSCAIYCCCCRWRRFVNASCSSAFMLLLCCTWCVGIRRAVHFPVANASFRTSYRCFSWSLSGFCATVMLSSICCQTLLSSAAALATPLPSAAAASWHVLSTCCVPLHPVPVPQRSHIILGHLCTQLLLLLSALCAAAVVLWGFLHSTISLSCLAGSCMGILLIINCCCCTCAAAALVVALARVGSICSAALAVICIVLLIKL